MAIYSSGDREPALSITRIAAPLHPPATEISCGHRHPIDEPKRKLLGHVPVEGFFGTLSSIGAGCSGVTCLPTSKAITIVSGSTPPSTTSPRSHLVSALSWEAHHRLEGFVLHPPRRMDGLRKQRDDEARPVAKAVGPDTIRGAATGRICVSAK